MKEIKYRWYGADGTRHYRRDELPDSAEIFIGNDKDGREVWSGDTVIDDFGNELSAEPARLPIERLRKKTDHIRPAGYLYDRKDVWK